MISRLLIALILGASMAFSQTRNVSGTPSGNNLTITTPSGTLILAGPLSMPSGGINVNGAITLGSQGVIFDNDADGAVTIQGQGNGFDELIKLDLDNVSNTATWSSSTGVASWDLTGTTFTLHLGTAGATLIGNSNGSFSILGRGDGTDERLTWDLNSSNVVTVSSSSGVTVIDHGSIGLSAGTGVFVSTNSLLLGTAGSAVGNIGFRNATSGTITLAPTTGALGTVTLTMQAVTGTIYSSGGTDVAVADGGTGASSLNDLITLGTHTTGNYAAGDAEAGGATKLRVAAGSSTLSADGDIAVDSTNASIAFDGGTLGELVIPAKQHQHFTFDPKAVCDGTIDRLQLMRVGSWAPNGITMRSVRVSFEADPTTEIDADLKRADAVIGVANAAVVLAIDTTAGVKTEETAGNLNGGAVIATGKVLYIEFVTPYSETGHQIIVDLEYTIEED